jgi:inner membrane protein
MDTLTHAFSGALIARATAPKPGTADAIPLGRRVGIGLLAAAFPVLDFIACCRSC